MIAYSLPTNIDNISDRENQALANLDMAKTESRLFHGNGDLITGGAPHCYDHEAWYAKCKHLVNSAKKCEPGI